MADILKVGEQVKQVVVSPIVGEIKDVEIHKGDYSLRYLVAYKDADGTAHEKWFHAHEVVPAKGE